MFQECFRRPDIVFQWFRAGHAAAQTMEGARNAGDSIEPKSAPALAPAQPPDKVPSGVVGQGARAGAESDQGALCLGFRAPNAVQALRRTGLAKVPRMSLSMTSSLAILASSLG